MKSASVLLLITLQRESSFRNLKTKVKFFSFKPEDSTGEQLTLKARMHEVKSEEHAHETI